MPTTQPHRAPPHIMTHWLVGLIGSRLVTCSPSRGGSLSLASASRETAWKASPLAKSMERTATAPEVPSAIQGRKKEINNIVSRHLNDRNIQLGTGTALAAAAIASRTQILRAFMIDMVFET